jgi:hypothetical protein
LTPDKPSFFKLTISVVLFLVSGLLSTWLYYHFSQTWGIIAPGVLYTCTTVLIFLLTKKKLQLQSLTTYCTLMILTYLVVWAVTMFSSWFVVACGILTAGAGAVATFMLANKFITKIPVSTGRIFITGGLAFLVTDILYYTFSYTFGKKPIEYLFNARNDPETLLIELFVFWHVFVGTRLFLTLSKV